MPIVRVDFRYPSSSRMIHPLFRLSSSKSKWREISRWRERYSRVASGWLGWLMTTFRHRCRVTRTTTLIALRLLSCLGHPTKLYSLPRSCFLRSLIPISDTVSFNGMTFYRCLLRVYGIFLSKDVPFILLPLTIFDCLSLSFLPSPSPF